MSRFSSGVIAALLVVLSACTTTAPPPSQPFTLAVIPDTQNMVSYKHQTGEGFAIDGAAQFMHQMETIARWRDARARPLAFAIGVGDVWQHQTLEMDADHRARGFETVFNPYFDRELAVTDR
ncbi:MAG: serine/threonine protein phosphatase, partial [Halioglobus sp.]|nr:serine/threonine protein phosphatase [Halioglobus sp.]